MRRLDRQEPPVGTGIADEAVAPKAEPEPRLTPVLAQPGNQQRCDPLRPRMGIEGVHDNDHLRTRGSRHAGLRSV